MDIRDKAYQWIDEHKDEMISLWREMVTIDSGIGVREGGMAMGNLCAGILENWAFPFVVCLMKNAGTPLSVNGEI